jgi:hypothetical protein
VLALPPHAIRTITVWKLLHAEEDIHEGIQAGEYTVRFSFEECIVRILF